LVLMVVEDDEKLSLRDGRPAELQLPGQRPRAAQRARKNRGSRQRTAELLGISTRTLLRKIQEYGLEDPLRGQAPSRRPLVFEEEQKGGGARRGQVSWTGGDAAGMIQRHGLPRNRSNTRVSTGNSFAARMRYSDSSCSGLFQPAHIFEAA